MPCVRSRIIRRGKRQEIIAFLARVSGDCAAIRPLSPPPERVELLSRLATLLGADDDSVDGHPPSLGVCEAALLLNPEGEEG